MSSETNYFIEILFYDQICYLTKNDHDNKYDITFSLNEAHIFDNYFDCFLLEKALEKSILTFTDEINKNIYQINIKEFHKLDRYINVF